MSNKRKKKTSKQNYIFNVFFYKRVQQYSENIDSWGYSNFHQNTDFLASTSDRRFSPTSAFLAQSDSAD